VSGTEDRLRILSGEWGTEENEEDGDQRRSEKRGESEGKECRL
jgi:hypothetical protein